MSDHDSTDAPELPTQPMPEVLLDRAGTLVIDKPAGISSQMRVDTEGVSIIERVRRNGFPRAELPHRLDRMTGGVLVVATDLDTLRFHNEGDLWEDCDATLRSDSNFRLPRSTGGGITAIEGELGSHYPHGWNSGLQSAPTTCSGESETVAYAKK